MSDDSSLATKPKYFVDCPVIDATWVIRCLEFMSKTISPIVPFCFRGTGFSSNMMVQQEKKKSSEGFIIRGYLRYDQASLPGYQLYSDHGEHCERCNKDKDVLAFGIDGQVITSRFPKTGLKASSTLHLFSKSGNKSLYYKKDDNSAEYTFKTVVGFVMEDNPVPSVVLGNDVYDFSSKRPVPNVCMTAKEFDAMCGAMKANEKGVMEISAHRRGATFKSYEYGNPGSEVLEKKGIQDKVLDKIVMDVKFFSRMHGHVDKFCQGQSIAHIYFGRNKGASVITIVFTVGYSGHFLYQMEIPQ